MHQSNCFKGSFCLWVYVHSLCFVIAASGRNHILLQTLQQSGSDGLSVCWTACLSVCLSVCPSVSPSSHRLSLRLLVCLSVRLSFRLSPLSLMRTIHTTVTASQRPKRRSHQLARPIAVVARCVARFEHVLPAAALKLPWLSSIGYLFLYAAQALQKFCMSAGCTAPHNVPLPRREKFIAAKRDVTKSR